MAADPTIAKNPVLAGTQGAFENELPTYRAISPMALFSTSCGLLSVLSFVSPNWLGVAFIAVAAGLIADYRIRKVPDLLTGRSFAHAGIAMGLVFSVTSLSYSYWATYTLNRNSMAFAKEFTQTLNVTKSKPVLDTSDVMWYMLPPTYRSGVSPEEARAKIAELTGEKGSEKVVTVEMLVRKLVQFAGPDNPIEVVSVEDSFFQDGDVYATVLLHLIGGQKAVNNHAHEDSAKSKDQPGASNPDQSITDEGGPQNALLVIHGMVMGREYQFYVDQLKYPYSPKSYKAVPTKPKADDDGHGHAH